MSDTTDKILLSENSTFQVIFTIEIEKIVEIATERMLVLRKYEDAFSTIESDYFDVRGARQK